MKNFSLRPAAVPAVITAAVLIMYPLTMTNLTATLGFSEGFAFWLVSAIELVGAAAVWIPWGGWIIDTTALMIDIYGGDAAVVW